MAHLRTPPRTRWLLLGCLAALPALGDTPPAQGSLPVQTVMVPATSEEASTTVHLSGIDRPAAADLQVTIPPSAESIVPKVTVTGVSGAAKEWDVELKAGALSSFAEWPATVWYQGQPKIIVRFFKPGLVVKKPDGDLMASEESFKLLDKWFPSHRGGTPLTIVLENPAAVGYAKVRARLRFQNADVCEVATDNAPSSSPGDNSKCDDPGQWASFSVGRFTTTTLRATGAEAWFRDPQTGSPKAGTRAGTLTLRYERRDDSQGRAAVYQQDIPINAKFDPSSSSLMWSLLKTAVGLLIGALISLVLRVTIPNYRRKRAIREQLTQAAKATRGISDGVNSMLRVLLRVERLTLQSNLRAAWIWGPGFADVAQRVEQSLATTKRKIDFARRLDAARGRQSGLTEAESPPARLDNIDHNIAAVTDALLRDQLGEQDWVFIQQRLETVDKLLGEPSKEEKDAFEALLAQRWKAISEFFGKEEDGRLKVPPLLAVMKDCFPAAVSLPQEPDASRWVKNIGLTRADLQLTALELVRDLQLLLPSTGFATKPWSLVPASLTELLQSPGIETLTAARRILRELEQRTNDWDIAQALAAGDAVIEVDPQTPARNEKTRLFLRFREPRYNAAVARFFIECEWELADQAEAKQPQWYRSLAQKLRSSGPDAQTDGQSGDEPATGFHERGWEIYHYFESDIARSDITVRFYEYGKRLMFRGPDPSALVTIPDYKRTVYPSVPYSTSDKWWHFYRNEKFQRVMPEALQLGAALLVPLAALAVAQAGQTTGQWWDLIGIGFGSETIRNILTGTPEQSGGAAPQTPAK